MSPDVFDSVVSGAAAVSGALGRRAGTALGVLGLVLVPSGIALGGGQGAAGGLAVSGSACEGTWAPTFGTKAGINGTVFSLLEHDDGSGPGLFAGGDFTAAGGLSVARIARWDGVAWSELAGGLSGGSSPAVYALVEFDDGNGPALYVGGTFTHAGGQPASRIARWDGTSWSPLGEGLNAGVRALEVFDDGSGPALYAGGFFTAAGGQPASRIARWDGSSWSALGDGVGGEVRALKAFDDGSGPALHVAGGFLTAGGQSTMRVARWDGSGWGAMGSGFSAWIETLAVFDDGSGPALHAAGDNSLSRWDGVAWSVVPGAPDWKVFRLSVVDEGAGQVLYAGGSFSSAGGSPAKSIARFDGLSWTALGAGSALTVHAIQRFDPGSGSRLYVGTASAGALQNAFSGAAQWDGAEWQPIGTGLSSQVRALEVADLGDGPAIYAGGDFWYAGTQLLGAIARWDGAAWSPLQSPGGGSSPEVHVLRAFSFPDAPSLYAAGSFAWWPTGGLAKNIARWDGSTWSSVAPWIDGTVRAMELFDDGSGRALYIGGDFNTVGWLFCRGVARWDGDTWGPVGGIDELLFSKVQALKVFDDGSGPSLYAGGNLTINSVPVGGLARWDGTAWSVPGSGLQSGQVRALEVFDLGSGPALIAGGNFQSAGALAVAGLAAWDGATWSAFGQGVAGEVRSLRAFDGGSGGSLYVGGEFSSVDGVGAQNLARWDGSGWSAVGAGLPAEVLALRGFDDGSGPALFVGGGFTLSPGGDSFLAKWVECPQGGFVGLPGCFGNGASLTGSSGGLVLGRTSGFDLQSGLGGAGVGLLYGGFAGVDPAGCGLPLPGLGEWLLGLAPGPLLLGTQAAPSGSAQFALALPVEPQWVGLELAFQGVFAVLSLPGTPLELSNGLVATVTP